MGPKTALLLETFARMGRQSAGLVAGKLGAAPEPKRRKAGCTPCEAARKVAEAKERVRNGR